ncbi:hypothetical protein D3C80_1734680 [compost metagenome]
MRDSVHAPMSTRNSTAIPSGETPSATGSESDFRLDGSPSIHFPPVHNSIAPRYSPSVPSVATIAGIRSPTTSRPLNAPASAPIASANSIDTGRL